jgi:hypothetical protein
MMWAVAERNAKAPNKVPTSELRPEAWRHTAPSECREGFPPEVKDDRHERAINITDEDAGVSTMRALADASTKREHRANILSK